MKFRHSLRTQGKDANIWGVRQDCGLYGLEMLVVASTAATETDAVPCYIRTSLSIRSRQDQGSIQIVLASRCAAPLNTPWVGFSASVLLDTEMYYLFSMLSVWHFSQQVA